MTTPALESHAARQLLAVARCPIMAECLDREISTAPCAAIARFQWTSIDPATRIARWRQAHQLPEPWVGHIAEAPILFVSSNPSIRGQVTAEGLAAPTRDGITWDTADDEIVDRFENAFDKYMVDGVRWIGAKRATRYWSSIKRRAQELIPDRPVRPGHDYALTEVVRCKSRSEVGVADAAPTCIERHLTATIELSAARVIVGIGAHARRALTRQFQLTSRDGVHRPSVGERERLVVFLPHPNSFGGSKSFEGNLAPDELELLRSRLADAPKATEETPVGD
jgi:hypothetical protein